MTDLIEQSNKFRDHNAGRMALIPAGEFEMGSDSGGDFEKPIHIVELDEFLIDETLVSNRHFSEFVEQTGYRTTAEFVGSAWGFDGKEFKDIPGLCWRLAAGEERLDHPVVYVSWNDAVAFAKWAGKRLPTEAEIERAMRGRNVSDLYPWGNGKPDLKLCCFGRAPKEAHIPPTDPVKTNSPNDFGIYHAVGNVWVWASDWFGEQYYAASPRRNPVGPSTGDHKVRRGGAWNVIQAFRLRCANRGAVPPSFCAPNIGFRCSMSIE